VVASRGRGTYCAWIRYDIMEICAVFEQTGSFLPNPFTASTVTPVVGSCRPSPYKHPIASLPALDNSTILHPSFTQSPTFTPRAGAAMNILERIDDQHGNTSDPQIRTVATAESTGPQAGLFKLPAELRNLIYELVIIERRSVSIPPAEDRTHVKPGLLQVNREIRAEALPIYYGGTHFRGHDHVKVIRWFQSLPDDQLRMLRCVSLSNEWYSETDKYVRFSRILQDVDKALDKCGRGIVKRSAIFVIQSGGWIDAGEIWNRRQALRPQDVSVSSTG